MQEKQKHNEKIVEQFSKQAVSFTKIQGHYDSVDTLIKMSEVSKQDRVLDMACGTGIMACGFAKIAKEVIGLDITQEMLKQAHKKQNEENLTNIHFEIGDVEALPYDDESFDIVVTRYSFHHFLDVKKVFEEMIRVCKKGGKVMVVDVALEKQFEKVFNEMERLRDPSHTKALSKKEFENLFADARLSEHKISSYEVEVELEEQLNASFPHEGDKNKIQEIFKKDVNADTLGTNTHVKNGKIYFSYPISIFMAKRDNV
ncbi:MAG: methyltransferase domain-containing protein [Campylobacterales bacterium]|nr:methyltransferase domain-containing protein [Campylobacterales bacterium]